MRWCCVCVKGEVAEFGVRCLLLKRKLKIEIHSQVPQAIAPHTSDSRSAYPYRHTHLVQADDANSAVPGSDQQHRRVSGTTKGDVLDCNYWHV